MKRPFGFLLLAALAASAAVSAQTPDPPADHGAAALKRSLLEVSTTASFLQVTAHPDDEDGGLLTMLARGRGVRVGLVTLTRGEGGQNKIGPELFDALGVTRTEELLASDRYYGVTQFFTRAVDYGFSKTLAEALSKWRFADPDGGPVVADLVRVIRRFRPDVLVARFSGTRRDGHAHHEASSILARRAFEEAGDPSKFPDQIREGLAPWKPKKLYVGIIRANEDWTVVEDVGAYDPLLGASYAQLAWQGLSHQRTQGVGQVRPDPGARPVYYRRIDGTPAAAVLDAAGRVELPYHEGRAEPEKGFFDGIDTSLPGIADRLGAEEAKAPFLRPELVSLTKEIADAAAAFDAARPERCAPPLARALARVESLIAKLDAAPIAPPVRQNARFLLEIKENQLRGALDRSLSLALLARLEPEKEPGSPFPGFRFAVETARVAVRGASYPVSVALSNRSTEGLRILGAEISAPPGWRIETVTPAPADVAAGATARALFRVVVAADAAFTAPFWHRDSVEDPVYRIDDPAMIGDALPPFPLHARVRYSCEGVENTIETVVQTRTIDPLRGELARELAVEPTLSVRTTPPLAVVPLSRVGRKAAPIEVDVTPNASGARRGEVSLEAPSGWPKPAPQPFSLSADASSATAHFSVDVPPGTRPGIYRIGAAAGDETRTLDFLEHPDIGPFYFVKPAESRVEILDLAVPEGLSIGYVRGAEDSLPEFLQQLGIRVHLLSAEDLEKGNLSAYPTIVTGPRAYDVRDDLRRSNARLLAWVRNGGRLVVQYNSNTRSFNAGDFFPHPAKFPDQNQRVTVEDSPVEILSPDDPIWNRPNRITLRDFDGWVQERGLYFLGEWSADWKPLLSMHDPGEPPLRGGLLTTTFGKGTYVFTAESWFRELPEGVPGAIRIFVNLISPATAR